MIHIIGGGLAGSEAAWQAAERGVPVTLHEMRPVRATAVHKTDQLAELVCSNSFRGDKLDNAVGLLKEEMRRLGSIVMARSIWSRSRPPASEPIRSGSAPILRTGGNSPRMPSRNKSGGLPAAAKSRSNPWSLMCHANPAPQATL